MKKRKILPAVICAVLIITSSVIGTAAYLTDRTETVVNTFTAGKLLEETDRFELLEYKVSDSGGDGVYELTTEETDRNSYRVLPGVGLAKDPFVRTTGPLRLDAYVFIEVSDKTGENLTVTVDPDNWTKLEGITGPAAEGDVYVMKKDDGIAKSGETLEVHILKDNMIAVSETAVTAASQTGFAGDVSFYGYMVQASGFDGHIEAWEGLTADYTASKE